MATCGNCKAQGQTVEHIKECYASGSVKVAVNEVTGFAKSYADSRDFKVKPAPHVPDSYYALETAEGFKFYEVRTGKGKWATFQFVDLLVGAPGSWNRYPVKGSSKAAVLDEISLQPMECAVRYSREFTVCAVCGAPLSDPESTARGLGPICAKRF